MVPKRSLRYYLYSFDCLNDLEDLLFSSDFLSLDLDLSSLLYSPDIESLELDSLLRLLLCFLCFFSLRFLSSEEDDRLEFEEVDLLRLLLIYFCRLS